MAAGDKVVICFLLMKYSASLDCPPRTVNYNNESCYLFLDHRVTAFMYNDVLKIEKRGDKTRGDDAESLDPCVWSRRQAVETCVRIHEMGEYAHLADYTWHLPILETPPEDDWFNEQLIKLQTVMGTHVWIDLVRTEEARVWASTEIEATWFHRPPGIDPWWERCKVQMRKTYDSEVMCYEYHIDYHATLREPKQPMYVRGWHPRACYMAYEHESDLDHVGDFSFDEIKAEERNQYILPMWHRKCSFEYCAIPQDETELRERHQHEYHYTQPVFRWKQYWRTCGEAPSWLRGFHRMRLAPIGVACETNIGPSP